MVTVSVEPASRNRFLEALRRFAAETGQTMKDAALEQAALACEDAAIFTPPIVKTGGQGLSDKARQTGNEAVAGDIHKMFVAANDRSSGSASALLTNQLAYATKTNDRALFDKVIGKGTLQALKGLSRIMRKIANDQNHDRAFQKAKNYFNTTNPIRTDYGQGFVQELRPPHNRIKGKFGGRIAEKIRPTKVKMLVETKGELEAYIKERQAMVGYIKSGWASALRSLPKPMINGVPKNFGVDLLAVAWINRHTSAGLGLSRVTADQSHVDVLVRNNRGNVNNIAVDARVIPLVTANRMKQMLPRIKKLLGPNFKNFSK